MIDFILSTSGMNTMTVILLVSGAASLAFSIIALVGFLTGLHVAQPGQQPARQTFVAGQHAVFAVFLGVLLFGTAMLRGWQ